MNRGSYVLKDLVKICQENNFTDLIIIHETKLGNRISSVLKHIFPMPKVDTKRVMTFANKDDYISFRHHIYRKTDHKNVETKELGPRFELKPYQITLGTVDQAGAQKEWVLRPYMNSAKQKNYL